MPAAWPHRTEPRPGRLRPVLAAALLLALCLLGWRAHTVLIAPHLTGPAHSGADTLRAPGPADPLAAQAEYLLAPFTGEAHVRVIRASSPAALLILIDTASPTGAALTADRIGELLSTGGLYDPLAGETLSVQRLAFAGAAETGLPLAAGLELAALGVLAALLAGALLADGRMGAASRARLPAGAGRSPDAIALPSALNARQADPERVAALLRKWIAEDAA